MTLIDSRPAEINAREAPGHWEGGLIIGKGHKPAILVTAERKTRFVQMGLLESMDARAVRKRIEKRFKKLEPALMKSITLTRGKRTAGINSFRKTRRWPSIFAIPIARGRKGRVKTRII
jgi:IS30 family transposase